MSEGNWCMKLIFATHNQGKLKEMRALLAGLAFEVLSADEAGVTEDVIEDGTTFEENSLKKARFVSEKTGEWVAADDSGICIDVLGGAPGVFSARWAGEGGSDDALVSKTLLMMKDVPEEKRDAHFETVATLIDPSGKHWAFKGIVLGHIASAPRGVPRPKLPYDMVFIPEGHDRTFAEMSDEEKNGLSHRGRAFRTLRDFLLKQNVV